MYFAVTGITTTKTTHRTRTEKIGIAVGDELLVHVDVVVCAHRQRRDVDRHVHQAVRG
jgi:hypothetical protein